MRYETLICIPKDNKDRGQELAYQMVAASYDFMKQHYGVDFPFSAEICKKMNSDTPVDAGDIATCRVWLDLL